MGKDFDRWNKVKKQIEEENVSMRFPKEGEAWVAYVGTNVGYEQNGSKEDFTRPVLIVKKFNSKMFWVVPLSTQQKDFDFYYNYIDPHGNAVSAILAQMKLMSVKRLQRDLYVIHEKDLNNIKTRLKSFL